MVFIIYTLDRVTHPIFDPPPFSPIIFFVIIIHRHHHTFIVIIIHSFIFIIIYSVSKREKDYRNQPLLAGHHGWRRSRLRILGTKFGHAMPPARAPQRISHLCSCSQQTVGKHPLLISRLRLERRNNDLRVGQDRAAALLCRQ